MFLAEVLSVFRIEAAPGGVFGSAFRCYHQFSKSFFSDGFLLFYWYLILNICIRPVKKSCSIETYNFIRNRLQHRCFPVTFAKYLKTPILYNISERRIYLYENVYHMEFLVTVYMAKRCLPWCLINK